MTDPFTYDFPPPEEWGCGWIAAAFAGYFLLGMFLKMIGVVI